MGERYADRGGAQASMRSSLAGLRQGLLRLAEENRELGSALATERNACEAWQTGHQALTLAMLEIKDVHKDQSGALREMIRDLDSAAELLQELMPLRDVEYEHGEARMVEARAVEQECIKKRAEVSRLQTEIRECVLSKEALARDHEALRLEMSVLRDTLNHEQQAQADQASRLLVELSAMMRERGGTAELLRHVSATAGREAARMVEMEQECEKARVEVLRLEEEMKESAAYVEHLKSQIWTESSAIQKVFARLQMSIEFLQTSRQEFHFEDTALDVIAAAHGVSLDGGFQCHTEAASILLDDIAEIAEGLESTMGSVLTEVMLRLCPDVCDNVACGFGAGVAPVARRFGALPPASFSRQGCCECCSCSNEGERSEEPGDGVRATEPRMTHAQGQQKRGYVEGIAGSGLGTRAEKLQETDTLVSRRLAEAEAIVEQLESQVCTLAWQQQTAEDEQ